MLREKRKWRTHERESTDARHGGGSSRILGVSSGTLDVYGVRPSGFISSGLSFGDSGWLSILRDPGGTTGYI
jgi:hypothetical protein